MFSSGFTRIGITAFLTLWLTALLVHAIESYVLEFEGEKLQVDIFDPETYRSAPVIDGAVLVRRAAN